MVNPLPHILLLTALLLYNIINYKYISAAYLLIILEYLNIFEILKLNPVYSEEFIKTNFELI